jgi:DNA-binding MarR family transcriptional regulator
MEVYEMSDSAGCSVVPTLDEWRSALQEAERSNQTDEGFTVQEMMEITGVSKSTVLKNLRRLIKDGKAALLQGKRSVKRIDGGDCLVPAYKLVEKKNARRSDNAR